jgi:hypothetical protein
MPRSCKSSSTSRDESENASTNHSHENLLRLKLPPFEIRRPWLCHLPTYHQVDAPKLQHCPAPKAVAYALQKQPVFKYLRYKALGAGLLNLVEPR